jgi:hypothetical protein
VNTAEVVVGKVKRECRIQVFPLLTEETQNTT